MALIDTAKIGKKGGEARAKNLSAKERSESASKAATARWGPKKKPATKKAAKATKGKN
jgi:hypothetical protein